MGLVAFVTDSNVPEIFTEEGDHLLANFLESNGCRVVAVPWDSSDDVDWSQFDLVLVRSSFNYHTKASAFLEWICRMESQQVRLFNPPSILRWNASKTYLRDLERKGLPEGVALPTTVWVSDVGQIGSLKKALSDLGIKRAVVKPVVGADSMFQWTVRTESVTPSDNIRLEVERRTRDLFIQEYVDAIDSCWEMNLMFCRGTFTHAILKSPTHGTGRLERQRFLRCVPDTSIVDKASRVVRLLDGDPMYARVDMVVRHCSDINWRDENFVPAIKPASSEPLYLMEVELIEPSLYISEREAEIYGKEIMKLFPDA